MLEVRDIHKSYEGQPLLRGISFTVHAAETVCLLGPSGSGKSTLLRIIAGLEPCESGQVLWDGADLVDVPVNKRNFGLMFQDYALFPHRTVAENVAFGLRMRGLPVKEVDAGVRQGLERVNLTGFEKRKVTDLSGGEQQRVALARALAPQPALLMLDEPLGALDHSLRAQLMEELRTVLRDTGVPAVYVTHDQEEAFALADRLVLLREGRIEQEGVPEKVFGRPASAWAARFFGLTNILNGQVLPGQLQLIRTSLGDFQPVNSQAGKTEASLLLKPFGARLVENAPRINGVCGRVLDTTFTGEGFKTILSCGPGLELSFNLHAALSIGEPVCLALSLDSVVGLE